MAHSCHADECWNFRFTLNSGNVGSARGTAAISAKSPSCCDGRTSSWGQKCASDRSPTYDRFILKSGRVGYGCLKLVPELLLDLASLFGSVVPNTGIACVVHYLQQSWKISTIVQDFQYQLRLTTCLQTAFGMQLSVSRKQCAARYQQHSSWA